MSNLSTGGRRLRMAAEPEPEPEPVRIRASAGEVDEAALRRLFACFATGVTIITTNSVDGPVGMTVNSFTSASLRPPLVMFCAADMSRTLPQIRAAGCFAVNILASGGDWLAERFASRDGARFSGVTHAASATGLPVFPDPHAYLECVLHDTHRAGDHTIVIGRVVAAAKANDRLPLIFFQSRWHSL
jgi:3-hydroxy-9,10-secoandrosta-1,3,5(10)-triene-9,17-dione monooxygenase reductase component